MTAYLVLVVTTTLVGLAAVLLRRRKDTSDSKVFLAAALANAGALLGIWLLRKRRKL